MVAGRSKGATADRKRPAAFSGCDRAAAATGDADDAEADDHHRPSRRLRHRADRRCRWNDLVDQDRTKCRASRGGNPGGQQRNCGKYFENHQFTLPLHQYGDKKSFAKFMPADGSADQSTA